MGRAARKDAAEDASWRRLPQRVSWRFYPAFEGLFVAARSAVVFLAVRAHARPLRATVEPRRAPAQLSFQSQQGEAVPDDLRSVSRQCRPILTQSRSIATIRLTECRPEPADDLRS